MTVGELITKLGEYDSELMVVVDGYENGVKEVKVVDEVRVRLNVNTNYWEGPHEIVRLWNEKGEIVAAVYLPR